MFDRIVVAYDGSEPSRAAAQLAFRIAQACEAKVVLSQVVESTGGLPAHPQALADIEHQLHEREVECRDQLKALEKQVPPGTPVESRVMRGQAASTLLETLRDQDASLALAGTHGVGGLKPLLGSVSHQLVEHAPCPVLLVRNDPPSAHRIDVIAALDGSEASMRGLATAQTLAAALGASLRLVHVIDPSGSSSAVQEMLRDHGHEILREARATITAPLEDVVEDLREGPPRAELIAACEEHAPAIAAVGTRGVGGFANLLFGSTARALVNHAPCPVLVTKA